MVNVARSDAGDRPTLNRVSWAAVTGIGAVLAGLALPLAFIQLGALRQDRLRAQVSRVGAWTGTPHDVGQESVIWSIP